MFGLTVNDKFDLEEAPTADATLIRQFIRKAMAVDKATWETLVTDFTQLAIEIKNGNNVWKLHDTQFSNGTFMVEFAAKRTDITATVYIRPDELVVGVQLHNKGKLLAGYNAYIDDYMKDAITPLRNIPGRRYQVITLYGPVGMDIMGEASRLLQSYMRTAAQRDTPVQKEVFDFTKDNGIVFGL